MKSSAPLLAFISTIESIALILIGVAASQLQHPWAVVGMVGFGALVGVGRYIAAAPVRSQEAREWLTAYWEDPSHLEETLTAVYRWIPHKQWERIDMTTAVGWWIEQDLSQRIVRVVVGEPVYRAGRITKWKSKTLDIDHGPQLLDRRRSPFLARLERFGSKATELDLWKAVNRLSADQVAGIVTKAGVEAGFLEQTFNVKGSGLKVVAYRSTLHDEIEARRHGQD